MSQTYSAMPFLGFIARHVVRAAEHFLYLKRGFARDVHLARQPRQAHFKICLASMHVLHIGLGG